MIDRGDTILKIRSIKYHLKQGVKGVFKNGLMSFASIASVIICAFMFIISLCVAINLDSALEKIEKGVGISIFLAEEISDEETTELLHLIEKIPNVASIDYVSKQDALNWAKEQWGDEQSILAGLEDDNPFPRSFELTINGAKYQKQVVKDIEKIRHYFEKELVLRREQSEKELKEVLENSTPIIENKNEVNSQNSKETEVNIGDKGYEYIGIEKVKHSQKQADILLTANNAIRFISLIITLILAIISVGIIVNTIKLTVYIRKNEINIMKYVGATDWFIRWPFIFEGIFIGLIGSLIPVIICTLLYGKINTFIYENLPFIKNYIEFKDTFSMFLIVAPSTILLGILLGAIGSVNSIKKHLNV